MQIEYNNKVKAVCTNADKAIRTYGVEMAEKLHSRLDQIRAIDSVEHLIQFQFGRCHALKGNRKNQYAMDLVHPYRLIFEKKGNDIQIVRIIEITDYH
mgnify:CR=1 FL=1